MYMYFFRSNPEITSFAMTQAAPQTVSEQVLAELRHLPRLENLLVVWGDTSTREPLLKALSTNVSASLKGLYLIIGQEEEPILCNSHPQF